MRVIYLLDVLSMPQHSSVSVRAHESSESNAAFAARLHITAIASVPWPLRLRGCSAGYSISIGSDEGLLTADLDFVSVHDSQKISESLTE